MITYIAFTHGLNEINKKNVALSTLWWIYYIPPTINEDLHQKFFFNIIFFTLVAENRDISFRYFEIYFYIFPGWNSELHKRSSLPF